MKKKKKKKAVEKIKPPKKVKPVKTRRRKIEQTSEQISFLVTPATVHYLNTRVIELTDVLESKTGISRSWLIKSYMDFGMDLFNSIYLEVPTEFEESLRKIAMKEKNHHFIRGINRALEAFREYLTTIKDEVIRPES